MIARLLLPLLLLVASPLLAFDHQRWDRLLAEHVQWQRSGVATGVDYPGFRADRAALDQYLQALSQVSGADFQRWSKDEQLAFLINAYNAFTIDLILRQDSLPDSIRDIGSFFSGPWDQRFFTLLGETRTLDEVEHEMIRGNPALMDPRIHFAVNCASVGCPALRPEAYRAETLEQQLADSTRRFLSDRQGHAWKCRRFSTGTKRISWMPPAACTITFCSMRIRWRYPPTTESHWTMRP